MTTRALLPFGIEVRLDLPTQRDWDRDALEFLVCALREPSWQPPAGPPDLPAHAAARYANAAMAQRVAMADALERYLTDSYEPAPFKSRDEWIAAHWWARQLAYSETGKLAAAAVASAWGDATRRIAPATVLRIAKRRELSRRARMRIASLVESLVKTQPTASPIPRLTTQHGYKAVVQAMERAAAAYSASQPRGCEKEQSGRTKGSRRPRKRR